MIEDSLFNKYKPLRNQLKQLPLWESLGVVRAYIQLLQIDQPLPKDVLVLKDYLTFDITQKRRFMAEWNLAVLAKEIILNAQEVEPNRSLSSLKDWNDISRVINKLKDLEGEISLLYIDKTNVSSELRRTFFLQFPWQIQRPHNILMFKYFDIFSDKKIDSIIINKYGLSIRDIYTIGLLFWGAYIDNLAIYYPPKIEVEGINIEKIDKFLKYFSTNIIEVKKRISDSNKINENFLYQFNPLRYYPIIKGIYSGRDALICPIPTFLFWRLTGGIYYDLIKENNFDNFYGKSFENYVSKVLEKTNLRNLPVYRDKEYFLKSNEPKKTVDFVVGDNREILFIECKTKRLSIDSQISIDINKKVDEDYNILADGIFQVYKTLKDYLNNKYPCCKHSDKQKIYPIILTLEDWFISGQSGISIDALIRAKVEDLFVKNKMSLEILDKYPYSIMCIDEFELAIQAMQQKSFHHFIEEKICDTEKITWPFSSYTNMYCKKHDIIVKELFDKNYINNILPGRFTK
jgi:hypothetical protein